MQDNQSLDKFQAMQLAATLLQAQQGATAASDAELAARMLNLAEIIREQDRERVRERIGTPHLGC
ncbi:hypothetical protein [Wielerella bovis]|uniref:hypothetical protein n=1 Tax=Wielerella bovis TaxID=2917790 RepID=UPI002019521C|nr:hypothetical protein [Wielerella bovis]MCG7657370.1 hypothetical protein [Wielerella bovis]MCG7659591.1 hypothetical protein [Wielerella bovis]ULJ59547.1 hypothetical protein MIS44_07540 [Wielerella bovis]ULJ61781.1 hypothetical protein MIS46_07165 [Wielerella bovis]ULJ63905.1 hypothetical protein MIS33_06945 [Wielerella bovis]